MIEKLKSKFNFKTESILNKCTFVNMLIENDLVNDSFKTLDSRTVSHIYYNVFLEDQVINLFFYKCKDILFMLEKIQKSTTKIDQDFWISAEDFLLRVKTKYSPRDI